MSAVFARARKYIPLFLILALVVTVSFQVATTTVCRFGEIDLDATITEITLLSITSIIFVVIRKFDNFRLELGLALIIYAMGIQFIEEFLTEFSLFQIFLLTIILITGLILTCAGVFSSRRKLDRNIERLRQTEAELLARSAELAELNGALEQTNRKLRLLTQITRHDINNQLTLLRGYLCIAGKNQPDTTRNEYFQKATAAAERISAMIRFTGEYEKIGVRAPCWQDCRALVGTATAEAPTGPVRVINDIPERREVFADPLIRKVFFNLMDNAVRYGGGITSIRFSVDEHEGDPVLVCEDDGNGVLPDEKERIFERGFGKNTGLGLALSREILDITGITISETGTPGRGARFEILIPKRAYRTCTGVTVSQNL
ncbi:sensor histidine kinase [Methanoregula sp.]|uniref:sensor histidine kinase n=1 Tax=Methanoregula sp. TaxID=2052170 RepID=UPI0035673DB6